MASAAALTLVDEQGWRRGFANLFRQENGQWWRTRRWWVQTVLWLVAINGPLAAGLWLVPVLFGVTGESAGYRELFAQMMAWWPMFGVIILTQDSIVGEKQAGTAAWILSGPVSRPAFVLAKLAGNALGFLVTLILLQGVVAYAQLSLWEGRWLSPAPFATALALSSLYLLFYLTLTLALGTFFASRGPVLGIALGIALLSMNELGRFLAALAGWTAPLLPEALPALAESKLLAQPLPTAWPVSLAALSLYIGVALVLAIWRFNREEF
ncbi:MAG: hypothetical protein CL878_09215 [Dehalococcoidia bacterium]|nr:hypothetical protein [Dehalococcoidia bacterium]